MSYYKIQPPWDFLVSASPFALQSYELSRLNHAANLRKEIGRLLDQWIEENSCAMLARWLIEDRMRTLSGPPLRPGKATSTTPRAPASDNFPAEEPTARGPR